MDMQLGNVPIPISPVHRARRVSKNAVSMRGSVRLEDNVQSGFHSLTCMTLNLDALEDQMDARDG